MLALTRMAAVLAMACAAALPVAAQTATDSAQPTASAAATPAGGKGATGAAYAPQKVTYHINFPGGEGGKAYNAALGNANNHVEAVGAERIDLRVVLHGDGIQLLQAAATDQAMQAKIADLKAKGVKFLVCNNTLVARKIDPATLFDVYEDDIVPSGVAELAKLQGEGFTYIRP